MSPDTIHLSIRQLFNSTHALVDRGEMLMARTPVVTIVQRRLANYRVPLFEKLRELLRGSGVDLRLLYGDPTAQDLQRSDAGELSWAERLPTTYFLRDRVCWQPFMDRTTDSNLIVLTHENRQINNLLAIIDPRRKPALAFWGHGRNMQSANPNGVSEQFKRWTARHVDWWFAYTQISAAFVRETGFPADRITVLNNCIDTNELRSRLQRVKALPRDRLRSTFGLGSGPVAAFIGSLYTEKRIGFLLEAARAIHTQIPDFELAIAGDGPDRGLVESAVTALPFIKYLGVVHGERKATLLATVDIVLNPGLVGLGILDCFAAGLPIVTTDCGLHSPEISYLQSETNGLMTDNSISAFTGATVSLLEDRSSLQTLCDGALESGYEYSIEQMAQRFCSGILACLSVVARPPP